MTSIYGLYIALGKWEEKPCFDSFIGIYRVGFDKKCEWGAPRKILRVAINLLTGKYKRFYKYYSKEYGCGMASSY